MKTRLGAFVEIDQLGKTYPSPAGPAEIVRDCPWEVESMTVGELLRSQRRWGRTRVRKFLFTLALNENRELGRLTERQRIMLAHALDAKCSGTVTL